jgi:hypothetical protein
VAVEAAAAAAEAMVAVGSTCAPMSNASMYLAQLQVSNAVLAAVAASGGAPVATSIQFPRELELTTSCCCCDCNSHKVSHYLPHHVEFPFMAAEALDYAPPAQLRVGAGGSPSIAPPQQQLMPQIVVISAAPAAAAVTMNPLATQPQVTAPAPTPAASAPVAAPMPVPAASPAEADPLASWLAEKGLSDTATGAALRAAGVTSVADLTYISDTDVVGFNLPPVQRNKLIAALNTMKRSA